MAITTELIGKLGGGTPAGYGELTAAQDMPREWSTVTWNDTMGALEGETFTGGGDYHIRAKLIPGASTSSSNTSARILVNGAVVHTTAATNPAIIDRTLSIPGSSAVQIQTFTDNSGSSNRRLLSGSQVVIIPID